MKNKKQLYKGLMIIFCLYVMLLSAAPIHAAATKYEDKWVKKSGKIFYYDSNGKKLTGMKEINGKTYYFDTKGVQRTGWQKIKKEYYFFQIANGKKGNMIKGKKIDGITLDKNGKAKKNADSVEKLEIMIKANQVVEKITDADMTKKQKLRKCFDYTMKTYHYTTWRKFSPVKNWDRLYASDMFDKGRGNCFSYAAAFGYLANAVGYSDLYVISSGGHGWVEIDGKVYDPDWALVSKVDSYFGMSYSLSGVNGRPNYKPNRKYLVKL